MELFTQNQNKLPIAERIKAPTPPLFAWIRNIGIIVAALSGAVMAIEQQGIQLPEWVALIADKAALIAGIIAAAVSQLTVDFSALGTSKIMQAVTKKKQAPSTGRVAPLSKS